MRVLAGLLCLSVACSAATLVVDPESAGFTEIQPAIDAAADGAGSRRRNHGANKTSQSRARAHQGGWRGARVKAAPVSARHADEGQL